MNAEQPSDDSQSRAPAFSSVTLMLVVICACLGFAGFWLTQKTAEGVGVGIVLSSAFLTAWLIATKQFRWVRISLGLLAIGLLMALCIPTVRTGGGDRRTQCANNLWQIGLALAAYEQKYGSFPPAYVADANGKPFYSWRVLILPELDEQGLYSKLKLDEPWDSPNNAPLSKKMLNIFDCPSDPHLSNLSGETSYLAVVGPHTAWSGTKPRKLSEIKVPSATILLVEAENSGVNWAEPRDLDIGQMPMAVDPFNGQGISSGHADGAWALFADGSTHFLQNNINPKVLAKLLDIGDKDAAALNPAY
jgi:hypothetical protein